MENQKKKTILKKKNNLFFWIMIIFGLLSFLFFLLASFYVKYLYVPENPWVISITELNLTNLTS